MDNSLFWAQAVSSPPLADNELHVWRALLDCSPAFLSRIASILSEEEIARAQRFLVPAARDRFVAARGTLRRLLGMYLDLAPVEIELNYGPEGKPSLSEKHNSKICFSISHSQDTGLFAFAMGHEVGVDIEESKTDFKGMQIASHFFSEEEIARLDKIPPPLAAQAFFECWTRKEAYVKARGQGLSIPLRDFTVDFEKREQVLRDEEGTAWSCYGLELRPKFAGAVVAAGEDWSLRYFDWPVGAENLSSALLPK